MDFERFEYLNPNLFLFVERKDSPQWTVVRRQGGFHELYFVVGGKAVFSVNGHEHEAEAGDIVYIPAGSIREAHTFKDCPMHAFAVNFHWLNNAHVMLPFNTVEKNKMNNEIIGYLKELQQLQLNKTFFFRMKERGLFMVLLNHLIHIFCYQRQAHLDPRVKKILNYIDIHYSESFGIDKLARLLNLHSVYLGKLFKENTGLTFKNYLNKIRVNNAEKLLTAGNFSVSEVAEKCGFNDIYYFSKVFKKTKGYSPSIVNKKIKAE